MKKALALLMAILMCVTVLAACKKSEETGGPDASLPTDNQDPNRIPPEVKDFQGYEFIIYNDSWCDKEIAAPKAMDGEGINDQVYVRNKNVENLYNITITEMGDPNRDTGEGFNLMNKQLVSGDYFTDLYSNDAGAMIASYPLAGFFYNIYNMKSLRLDSAWWDQQYLLETTINGKAYSLTGDIQTNDDLHERMLVMNLSLFKRNFQEDDIYKTVVTEGSWTIDKFYSYWQGFGDDVNSNGQPESDDMVGLGYDTSTATYMFLASGIRTFEMENGEPKLNIGSDKAINLAAELQKMRDGRGTLDTAMASGSTGANAVFTYEGVCQHFAIGKMLFNTSLVADALNFYLEMDDDVVYLPFPKYNTDQDQYYNSVHSCFEPIAISSNVKKSNLERTALITEALAFYSNELQKEVMDILIQERLSNDLEAREILLTSLNSKTFDIDYMGGVTGFLSKLSAMQNEGFSDYAGAVAATQSSAIVAGEAKGSLETFLEKYTKY